MAVGGSERIVEGVVGLGARGWAADRGCVAQVREGVGGGVGAGVAAGFGGRIGGCWVGSTVGEMICEQVAAYGEGGSRARSLTVGSGCHLAERGGSYELERVLWSPHERGIYRQQKKDSEYGMRISVSAIQRGYWCVPFM